MNEAKSFEVVGRRTGIRQYGPETFKNCQWYVAYVQERPVSLPTDLRVQPSVGDKVYRVMNAESGFVSDVRFETKDDAVARVEEMNEAFKEEFQTWVVVKLAVVPYMKGRNK